MCVNICMGMILWSILLSSTVLRDIGMGTDRKSESSNPSPPPSDSSRIGPIAFPAPMAMAMTIAPAQTRWCRIGGALERSHTVSLSPFVAGLGTSRQGLRQPTAAVGLIQGSRLAGCPCD